MSGPFRDSIPVMGEGAAGAGPGGAPAGSAARAGAASAGGGAAVPAGSRAGLLLVRAHRLVAGPVEATFPLRPGDRPMVALGEAVLRGATLAERLRDPRTVVVAGPTEAEASLPGTFWASSPASRATTGEPDRGELLFRSGGRWRIGTGDHHEQLEAPFAGIVSAIRPGTSIGLTSTGQAIPGREVLAGPTSGRLDIITTRDGGVRASEIDVSGAGAILVVGAQIDAEAITRARAVGVRGIIVAALGVKERRDVLASERRGQAAVHGLPPFAILVLDGAARRPIASPVMAILERLVGRTVAIVGNPPCLVIEGPAIELPRPEPDVIRVVSGPLVGAEGRWAGLGGPHRFPGGVILEAGLVRFAGRPPVAVPLGDIERFA
jgi:hypothetical protein